MTTYQRFDCQNENPKRLVPRYPEAVEKNHVDADYFLRTALDLITNARAIDYGDAVENHKNILRLWNAYLYPREPGCQLRLLDVPVMMALLKIARLKQGSIKDDTFVDLCGYGAIAGRIASIDNSTP